MEEESVQAKRLILAAILSFAALAFWQYLNPPQAHPTSNASSSADAGAKTSTKAAAPEPKPALAAPVESSTVTAEATPSEPIELERFDFSGKVEGDIPFELSLSNAGAALSRFQLPSFHERSSSNEPTDQPISLVSEPEKDEKKPDWAGPMLGISLGKGSSFQVPADALYEVVDKSSSSIRYRYRHPSGLVIEREYQFDESSFAVEMAVTIRNESKRPSSHVLELNSTLAATEAMEKGGMLFMPPPDQLSALCFTDGKVDREHQKSLKKQDEPEVHEHAVKWAGMDRQYFVSAIIQRDGSDAGCRMRSEGRWAQASLVLPKVDLAPGEERRHKFTAYVGVKKPELLTRVDSELESAIDYTIMGLNLAIICELLLALMGFIHTASGSWGVAILGLTVIVKGMLFPLNQRSGKSMRVMASLKPQLEELKTKYPDDRQRQSEEMMRIYRDNNVNPAGGCVPVLIQMPIWFALYRALWVSVDLYQQEFLWIPDLTARDPLWILPVALVAVMFLQQKMTPTAMDPAQQKMMMYVMPLLFGSMMSALPAGLCFYILVNSLLTIVQQHFINKSIGPPVGPPSEQGAEA